MNEFMQDKASIQHGHEWETSRRDAGQPAVALDFTTAWCPRHLSPWRAGWPAGAGVAMLKLFEIFTGDDRAQKMAGGDTLRLAAVVHECSPLCCFVGDEALAPLYHELGKEPPP